MQTIKVNGAFEEVRASTVHALLEEKGVDAKEGGLAVAVNGAIVPRSAWTDTALHARDAVEIVRAKQGG